MTEQTPGSALKYLHNSLGETLIALLAEANDEEEVIDDAKVREWLEGASAPSEEAQRRIDFAASIVEKFYLSTGHKSALEWFCNPVQMIGPDHVTPPYAIRQGRFPEVEQACQMLLRGEREQASHHESVGAQ